MIRHFFFVFLVWGAVYLSIIGLLYGLCGITELTNWHHIIIALGSVYYAFRFERRVFHEDD